MLNVSRLRLVVVTLLKLLTLTCTRVSHTHLF
ncbi:Uncharacterised protein [Vibrio cholerae]|nr:Uncharacterised protein [Vibrio cholerae]